MEYKSGDKIYFQFRPDYEDDTWYPGTILKHSNFTRCYEIVVKKQSRHYFAPPERIKIRTENIDEAILWKQLWDAANFTKWKD